MVLNFVRSDCVMLTYTLIYSTYWTVFELPVNTSSVMFSSLLLIPCDFLTLISLQHNTLRIGHAFPIMVNGSDSLHIMLKNDPILEPSCHLALLHSLHSLILYLKPQR